MKNLQGRVTMELSEYNSLIEMVLAYENAITLENAWGTSVRVSFNVEKFRPVIMKLLAEQFPDAKVNENSFNSWNSANSEIANLPKNEEEEV